MSNESNERADEFLSWRSRLDGPEGVPGQGLEDHEAGWERLMDRFKEQPRRKRFWGYGIAAACLLLLLIPAVWHFQDRHVVTTRLAPRPEPAAETRATVTVPLVRAEPVSDVPPREVAPAVGSGISAAKSNVVHSGVSVADRRFAAGRRAQEVKVAQLVESPAVVVVSPDSLGTNVIAKPLKKKELKVVNINEVSGSTAPSPAVTSTGRNVDFSIEPGQLKVKLSSSN